MQGIYKCFYLTGVNSNNSSNSKGKIIICGVTSGIVFILLLIAALYCYFTYFRQRKCTNLESDANSQLQYSCNNDKVFICFKLESIFIKLIFYSKFLLLKNLFFRTHTMFIHMYIYIYIYIYIC